MYIKVPILTACFCIAFRFLSGQCPGKDSLLLQIRSIKISPKIENADKLKKLVDLQKQISNCRTLPDSVVDTLILSVASVAYIQGEFLKSIENYQKYIDRVVVESRKDPSVIKKLPRAY